ncbi:ATPase, T2SS/T4P/T4SS family [Psychrobacillus sp. FSL H8-0487]|uniref:ATPase, T2SS/T4P/T4SS family n=1 Tax=Psychrobacillus sp. FSL H8-0487 TaxID=2921391 RepID=UPI0030FAB183
MTLLNKSNNYVPSSNRKSLDIKEFSRSSTVNKFAINEDFYTVCKNAKKYIYDVYDKKIDDRNNGNTKENYVNIFHESMQGVPSAVNLIKRHLESYVIDNGLRTTVYPRYYPSLIDGIFEEGFGWGPLSAFRQVPDCEGAQVIGMDITFKRPWGYELQPFKFRSLEDVLELTKRFANMNANTTINEHTSPEMETRTYDNIRVSVMIPHRTHLEPVITLRKQIVSSLSLNQMVEYGTIPQEAIPLFESLAKFKANSVIAGPPGCGKSTFLQVLLSNILYETFEGKKIPERIKTVYAETFPEWDIRKLNPLSNVLHILGSGEEFETVVTKALLRHDISRIVIGEIREHEVGLYKRASVQGIKQLMGTLHDLDPNAIPEILADLYMQYYSNTSNHAAVQHAFNRNLHFAISMDEFKDEETELLVKKVTGVHLYDVNEITKESKMFTIMEYDFQNDTWSYEFDVPKRFARMVMKYNRKEFDVFMTTLEKLSKKPTFANVK